MVSVVDVLTLSNQMISGFAPEIAILELTKYLSTYVIKTNWETNHKGCEMVFPKLSDGETLKISGTIHSWKQTS